MPNPRNKHHPRTLSPSIWRLPVPYVLTFCSWLLYTGLAMFAPAGTTPQTNYHLPPGGLNAIRFSILLPLLVFWLFAVYGAQVFRNYAKLTAGSPEANPLRIASTGLYVTLATFIISAVFGSLLNFYTQSVGYPGLVILHDHLVAFLTLAGFILFYIGSRQLLVLTSVRSSKTASYWATGITVLAAIGFSSRYVALHASHSFAADSALAYVSPTILLGTLVLPYFVAWYAGVLSVINIVQYARTVRGVLYRHALRDLALGLCAVISFSSLGGVLTLVASTSPSMNLGPLLLILYLALILYGAGYLFVANGARKLTMIEKADATR
jgi:hypothetical protein